MNKKILLASIFAVSFFLVFLGMRNPYLSGGSAPKQRPRAIVENTAKKSLEVVEQFHIESDNIPGVFCSTPKQVVTSLEVATENFVLPPVPSVDLAARAPPSPSTPSSLIS